MRAASAAVSSVILWGAEAARTKSPTTKQPGFFMVEQFDKIKCIYIKYDNTTNNFDW